MTPEELRALLLSGEEEGADRAAIYDQVVETYTQKINDYTQAQEKITASATRIDELTGRVGQLTDTNFKLLEKIRYTQDDQGTNPNGDEPQEITLEQLFEMEG